MKKIVALLVVVVIASGACAQDIKFGAKGGLNLASQVYRYGGERVGSPRILPSFHVGGYVRFKFSDLISLQPELLFSGQGSKSGDDEYTIKLSYVNVPVLVRFSLGKTFSLHAGPQVGFLVSAKQDYSGNVTDIRDDYKTLELAGAVGVMWDLPFGLNFTGRFVKGLSNTIADPGEDDYKERNFTIQFSVGFTFIGKGDK